MLAQLAFFERNFFWCTLASNACAFGSIFFYSLTDLEYTDYFFFRQQLALIFYFIIVLHRPPLFCLCGMIIRQFFHVSVYFTFSGDITFGPCMILLWSNSQRSWYLNHLAGFQTRFHCWIIFTRQILVLRSWRCFLLQFFSIHEINFAFVIDALVFVNNLRRRHEHDPPAKSAPCGNRTLNLSTAFLKIGNITHLRFCALLLIHTYSLLSLFRI